MSEEFKVGYELAEVKEKLEVGKAYRVDFEDCCVSGSFVRVLTKIEEPVDQFHGVELIFDFTIRLSNWMGVEFEEVPLHV